MGIQCLRNSMPGSAAIVLRIQGCEAMNGAQLGKVGEISEDVIHTLGLSLTPRTPIYIGRTNISHMLYRHPDAYVKYGSYISEILNRPDYVGINPRDGSVEYVKEFRVDNDFVKVAVRVANSGRFFARSLYVLSPSRVNTFITNGALKTLTKSGE